MNNKFFISITNIFVLFAEEVLLYIIVGVIILIRTYLFKKIKSTLNVAAKNIHAKIMATKKTYIELMKKYYKIYEGGIYSKRT